jgi:hypothetical protein
MGRDCKARPDNEFGFVRFFGWEPSANLKTLRNDFHAMTADEDSIMFAFDRSALAVLVPLALLLAVVVTSSQKNSAAPQQADAAVPDRSQTVAANLPSK